MIRIYLLDRQQLVNRIGKEYLTRRLNPVHPAGRPAVNSGSWDNESGS
jgi:hypothetical protein